MSVSWFWYHTLVMQNANTGGAKRKDAQDFPVFFFFFFFATYRESVTFFFFLILLSGLHIGVLGSGQQCGREIHGRGKSRRKHFFIHSISIR